MARHSSGRNVHVVPAQTPQGTKFTVKVAGQPGALTPPVTQAQAIQQAIPLAKQYQSDVVIHRRNGQIRDRDSYGHDPFPPRDSKH